MQASVTLTGGQVSRIDDLVSTGLTKSRAEFIRSAVADKLLSIEVMRGSIRTSERSDILNNIENKENI